MRLLVVRVRRKTRNGAHRRPASSDDSARRGTRSNYLRAEPPPLPAVVLWGGDHFGFRIGLRFRHFRNSLRPRGRYIEFQVPLSHQLLARGALSIPSSHLPPFFVLTSRLFLRGPLARATAPPDPGSVPDAQT